MAIKDYYAILGLPLSASQAEVKRRYRRMVKISHPDTGPGGRDTAFFLEIQEAYEALADPVRRAAYDRKHARRACDVVLASERPAGPVSDATQPWADPENDLIRAGSGAVHPGWDERYPVGDWSQGARSMGVVGAVGSARAAGRRIAQVALTLEEAFRGTDVDFGGVRVRIPPGARDGMTLRVPGADSSGTAAGAGVPGVIEISLLSDGHFRVAGDDLLAELAAPPALLEQGGQVRLQTPGGWLAVEIPGGLGPGRVLRLRGKGLPATARRRAGDILVRLVSAG